MQSTNRLDALLALRGFACLMVIIHHCNPPRNSIIYQNFDWSWLIFSHGWVAVWIFFVLSGYLMGKAFYTERYIADISGVIGFWRNRIFRIIPLYYFAVLILILFVYPNYLKIENWGYILRLLTFTYDFSSTSQPGMNFSPVFWSLSTEMQFYIFVPFIFTYLRYHIYQRKQVYFTAFVIAMCMFLMRCLLWVTLKKEMNEQFSYVIKYWYTPVFINLDLFLSGFLLNIWLKYQNYSSDFSVDILVNKRLHFPQVNKKYIAVILFVYLYLFTAYHLYHQELFNLPERAGKGIITATTFFMLQPLTAIITSIFIWAFESDNYHNFIKNEKLSFSSILRNPLRILEIFGNLSYGIYIWHVPILGNITPIFTSNIPFETFYLKFTATLILSVFLATVTYYLVELPFTKWKIYPQSKQ
jgi:peptidoglycan/LPS O-acetylase OafA/YrhL